jgi:hypothetical protein
MCKIMKIQQQHTCKKSVEFFGRNLITTPCLANSATTAGRTWDGQLSMTRIEHFAPAFRRDAMTGPMSSAYISMPLVSILHAISVVYTSMHDPTARSTSQRTTLLSGTSARPRRLGARGGGRRDLTGNPLCVRRASLLRRWPQPTRESPLPRLARVVAAHCVRKKLDRRPRHHLVRSIDDTRHVQIT